MTNRVAQLEAALRANAEIRVQAERLIASYVAPESDRPIIISARRRELWRKHSVRAGGSIAHS